MSADAVPIAGIQMDVAIGQTDANLARVRERVTTAAAGARLIVLPECVLTGYCFDSSEAARAAAVRPDGPELGSLLDLSRQLEVAICFGTLLIDGENQLRNAALVFDRGEWIDTYYKVHLPFLGVDRFVQPGEQMHRPLEVSGLQLGVHVCYEGGFPEIARCLTLAGADLIVLPTNWPEGSGVSCQVIPSCRALENRVYFLAVNRVGTEAGFRFVGNSSLAAPSGQELQRLSATEDAILYATIEPQLARQKRLVIQPGQYEVDRIADRRPALYGPLVQVEPLSPSDRPAAPSPPNAAAPQG